MTAIVAIRRLTSEDINMVAEIYCRSFGERLPWLTGASTRDEDRAFFRETVFPHCDVWGAVENGKVIGFAALRGVWLDHLYVLPEYQSRGVGSFLIRHCQLQVPELQLWTFQQNVGASRFYESHGFDLIRTTEDTGTPGREPDALYRWQRPPGFDPLSPSEAIIGA